MTDKDLVSSILDMKEKPLPSMDHTHGMSKEEFMAKWFIDRK